MRVFLARHGETEWNRLGLLQGQLESELTVLGQEQAMELASALSNRGITHIYSSALRRAQDTAHACHSQLQAPLVVAKALNERNFGELQGYRFADLERDPKYQKLWTEPLAFQPAGGESAQQSAARFQQFLLDLEQDNPAACCLLVSHGDIIRNYLSFYAWQQQDDCAPPLLCNGAWLALDFVDGQPLLVNGLID